MAKSTVLCQISKKEVSQRDAVRVETIRQSLMQELEKQYPSLDPAGYVSIAELNKVRSKQIKEMLESDEGQLSQLDSEVLKSIESDAILSRDLSEEGEDELTLGERIADNIAEFGGSWKFIIIFLSFIVIWISGNIFILLNKGFDPYPFILLNLILSCIAALQAPVIMMSQNRMETKDRKRAENDYKINLKAELEIRHLHEKMDHLILKQMQHLNDIQKIQLDLLEEISERKGKV